MCFDLNFTLVVICLNQHATRSIFSPPSACGRNQFVTQNRPLRGRYVVRSDSLYSSRINVFRPAHTHTQSPSRERPDLSFHVESKIKDTEIEKNVISVFSTFSCILLEFLTGATTPLKFSSLSAGLRRKLIEWNARAHDLTTSARSSHRRRFLRNFYFFSSLAGPIEIGAADPGAMPPVRRPRRRRK